MHQAKAKLADSSPNKTDFIKKYDDLKARNVRDLDALVYFLAEINDKTEVNKFFLNELIVKLKFLYLFNFAYTDKKTAS